MDKGYIHIYTGDGKGKTSACVGLSVRCAGSGQKVLFTQFLKDNSSSEIGVISQIPNLEFFPNERSFGFTFLMTEEEKKEAAQYYSEHFLQAVAKAKEGNFRMLVLDELLSVYNEGMVDHKEVCRFLKEKPENLEVVISGRNPSAELIELADYISEVKKIKHPFDAGVQARKGIEY